MTTTDRPALDRERVARIALELLDEVGPPGAGSCARLDPFALAPPDEFPTIAALAPLPARRHPDRTFEFGLDVLLDRLERRLAG